MARLRGLLLSYLSCAARGALLCTLRQPAVLPRAAASSSHLAPPPLPGPRPPASQAIYATAQLRSTLACPTIPGNLILGEGTVRAIATALEAALGSGEAATAQAAAALAKVEAQEGLGEAAAPLAGAEAPAVQEGIHIQANQVRGCERPLLRCPLGGTRSVCSPPRLPCWSPAAAPSILALPPLACRTTPPRSWLLVCPPHCSSASIWVCLRPTPPLWARTCRAPTSCAAQRWMRLRWPPLWRRWSRATPRCAPALPRSPTAPGCSASRPRSRCGAALGGQRCAPGQRGHPLPRPPCCRGWPAACRRLLLSWVGCSSLCKCPALPCPPSWLQAAAFVEVQTAYVAEHLGAALARQLSASLSTVLSHDMSAGSPQVGVGMRSRQLPGARLRAVFLISAPAQVGRRIR